MRISVTWVLGLGVAVVCGTSALAQQKNFKLPSVRASDAPAPTRTAAASGDIRIRNSANGTAVYDNRRGVSRISKDVVVTQAGQDFIMYCDDITYNERSNEAVAKGSLRLESRDSSVTGSLMRADFDAKVITIIGDVVMNSFGKGNGVHLGSGADFKHKPSQMHCERIDYNYQNRQAVVTGAIRMTQEHNDGTCDRILFDEEHNVAHLQGSVVFRNDLNHRTIRSQDVTVWIDDNMVQANNRTTVTTPRETSSRPVAPRVNVAPVPALPDDLLREFGHALPAAPTPRPPAPEPDDIAAAKQARPLAPETDAR